MKFKDIKKFTSAGNYQVNIGLRYLIDNIEKYKEYGLQINPDFQRGHVWTEDQQIAFVEYLLKGGKAQITLYFNHPGWMNSFKGDFVLVDGLQRLTACLKFLKNEIKAFDTFYKNFEDELPSMDVELIFNINNLKTRKEVLTWYLEMNTGGTIHSEEAIEKVKNLLKEEEKLRWKE